jgi:hypothetical protein
MEGSCSCVGVSCWGCMRIGGSMSYRAGRMGSSSEAF